jgi:hypothetical protein
MKKTIFLLALIISFAFLSCEKELPEPKLIEFEKQEVVSNYDWNLISHEGNSLNFIIKSGKVVFIYYWSVNDENIEKNFKKLDQFYQAYKTKMEFVFVTSDNQVDVRKFIEKNEVTFPIFYSLSPIPNPMKLDQTKKAYLISKKQRIVVDNKGDANWTSENFYFLVDGLIKQ